MFNLMNEISELVYVVDIDTYELLFINNAGKDSFGIDAESGLKCYRALQGKDQPCEFCTTPLLRADCFYTWEITNAHVGRHYLLKDRLIDWNGKHARLEIAFDTTAQEKQKTALENAAEIDSAMIDCLKTLYGDDDLSAALSDILKIVGTLLQSNRAFVFDMRDDELQLSHEWYSEINTSQHNDLKGMTRAQIRRWYKAFEQHQSVIITDAEALRSTEPAEYAFLKQCGIERIVVVPLELDGKISGFIGVSNPPPEKLENISWFLDTLGYFTASYIQRSKDKQRLERLSYYDTLTGLFNRNAFIRDLDAICKTQQKSIGVMYLNINGMKEMNDHHGHAYGDTILREVAEAIAKNTINGTLYRIGGDEFVSIMQEIPELTFEDCVRTIKNTFSCTNAVTVAIGDRWSNYHNQVNTLVLEASERMYADKKTHYYRQAVPVRYRHDNDDILNLTKPGVLQYMIEKEQFAIYIQPKVCVNNRQLIGAEALVRLQAVDGTLIPPDDFIPLLEETRLISMIDFFVFESTCAIIQKWITDGKNVVPISVNFSRYTLTENQFAKRLSQIWSKFQIPQNLIEIELTESMSADEEDVFLQEAENIRNLGFVVVIDDFGVKYANVSIFTQMKFDVLKIDKSLIAHLQEDLNAQIVVQSISDICRKMGIHLIVEGVETEEQFAVLAQLHCEGAQGYLFDKPIPIYAFEQKYIF